MLQYLLVEQNLAQERFSYKVDGMSKPRLLENLSVSQADIWERIELFVNEIGVVQNLHIS